MECIAQSKKLKREFSFEIKNVSISKVFVFVILLLLKICSFFFSPYFLSCVLLGFFISAYFL